MASTLSPTLLLEFDMATLPDDYTCTRGFLVIDVHDQVTVQGAGGDATQVQRQAGGTGAFTALCTLTQTNDAVGTIHRATSIAPAQDAFAVGDVMRVNHSAGNTSRANHFVKVLPDAIAGA